MNHSKWAEFFLLGCLQFIFASSATWAQGRLRVSLTDQGGSGIAGAQVFLIQLKRVQISDDGGTALFLLLPPGRVTVQAGDHEYGHKIAEVDIVDGREMELVIRFDISIHEDLIVSAAPLRKSISDVSQAVGVLDGDELIRKQQPSLGETLAQEPGVSATSFGAGASRPVIRGLGGDRIRILEGGLGSGDASSVSGDHAVSLDMMTVERIEILRGPASLRYGSNAVGGVINVIDNRIPEFVPSTPIGGTLELRGDTGADERGAAVNLLGGKGRVAWHGDYSIKQTHDYQIPGPPALGGLREGESGTLANSALKNKKGSVGVSHVGDRGFFGVSYLTFDSLYGVPGHGREEEDHHGTEGGEEHGDQRLQIDLEQRRFDGRAGLQTGGFFSSLGLRLAHADYEHRELEGDEVGTLFNNRYGELRGEAIHGEWGPFGLGSLGVQYSQRDFEAVGEEAFVPPNDTEKWGLYVYEEVARKQWNLTIGARYDHQINKTHPLENRAAERRSARSYNLNFKGLSASVGAIIGKKSPFSFSANLTRTERPPTAEELFSNGPHLATSAFEIGDPKLKKETSLGLDLQLRKKEGVFTGELNLFSNHFNDYIYEQLSAETAADLPVFRFLQEDAAFWGGELHVDAELLHREPHHLHLELVCDLVRAELEDGTPLARITPVRLGLGLQYRRPGIWAKAEIRHVGRQDRIAPPETVTDDYTLVNFFCGYHFTAVGVSHHLLLRASNLGDEEARNHNSFLKDRVLLPGRNISLSYQLSF